MDARQLLQSIETRGGVATVKTDATGAAKINVAPRSLALELLPDLQRFKPALLELLTAPDAPAPEPATPSPFRTVAPFLLVPATNETAPGAAKICQRLQGFERVFRAARRGELPTDALTVEIAGEVLEVESAAAAVCEIFAAWTKTARRCQRDRRDLTAPEQSALDAAARLLNHVWACFDGRGAAWLDLDALNRQLENDFRAMHRKQRKSEATP